MSVKPIISELTKVVRTSNVVSSQLDNEIVMMSIENNEYYGLNKTATEIWQLIENPIIVKDICSDLINKFEISYNDCLIAVIQHIETLLSKKLIEIVDL
jgi:hypothetical protein